MLLLEYLFIGRLIIILQGKYLSVDPVEPDSTGSGVIRFPINNTIHNFFSFVLLSNILFKNRYDNVLLDSDQPTSSLTPSICLLFCPFD